VAVIFFNSILTNYAQGSCPTFITIVNRCPETIYVAHNSAMKQRWSVEFDVPTLANYTKNYTSDDLTGHIWAFHTTVPPPNMVYVASSTEGTFVPGNDNFINVSVLNGFTVPVAVRLQGPDGVLDAQCRHCNSLTDCPNCKTPQGCDSCIIAQCAQMIVITCDTETYPDGKSCPLPPAEQ